MCPSYRLKLKYPFPSLSAMFNLLHSNMNQELFDKHLCNQGSHYKKHRQFGRDDFCYAKEAITCNHQINVSKDEWNTRRTL